MIELIEQAMALLTALDMIMRAEAYGGGPDFSEITISCPQKSCTWEHTYTQAVTIGKMIEDMSGHGHRLPPAGPSMCLICGHRNANHQPQLISENPKVYANDACSAGGCLCGHGDSRRLIT